MGALDDILEHHGIKGMKWGVRRSGSRVSVPASPDHARVAEIKGRAKAGGGTKALSNQELQAYITRVNLERQFKALQPGAQVGKFVTDLLVGVGKSQVTRVAHDAAGQQVGNLLKKKSTS